MIIVVNCVGAIVWFERKFALVISWASLGFWDELEELPDFLLLFQGSLGYDAKLTSYFAVVAASTCWASEEVVGSVIRARGT